MPAVVGERLRQIRELRRLTQKKLTELVAKDDATISQSAISQIESGRSHPSDDLLEAIAEATGFPPGFFQRPVPRQFPMGSLLFRARSSTTVRELAEAHRWAELVVECAEHLALRFEPLPNMAPRLSETSPTQAARLARSAFKLAPDLPILNVTHTLEQGGVLVLAVPMQLEKRDAFSTWLDANSALIVVTTGVPGDRLRFSIAHELGHLVLHGAPQGRPRELEREADQFASEFLMPEVAIEHELLPPITLANLGPLKRRWGVSIQALIMRAKELKIISTRRTQYLFKNLSQRGFRTREPAEFDISIEKPRVFRKMIESVYGEPVDPAKLGRDFDLPREVAAALIGVHATRAEVAATVPESDASKVVSIFSRSNPKD